MHKAVLNGWCQLSAQERAVRSGKGVNLRFFSASARPWATGISNGQLFGAALSVPWLACAGVLFGASGVSERRAWSNLRILADAAGWLESCGLCGSG